MNAKEEKIKEAYKSEFTNNEQDYDKRYESLKIWIDKNGWLSGTLYDVDMNRFDVSGHTLRPKSLQGIEDNNGWIRIESESDLPKETACYHVINKKGLYFRKRFLCHLKDYKNKWKQITHYQRIIKPKPPIY